MSYLKTTIGFFLFISILGINQPAQSFSLVHGVDLNETRRWDRNDYQGRGLAGKLEWNFEDNFNLKFAEGKITNDQLAQAITNIFNIWETAAKSDPEISDLVAFTQKGIATETYLSSGSKPDLNRAFQGSEISLFSRPKDAKLVMGNNSKYNIFSRNATRQSIAATFVFLPPDKNVRRPISTATNKEHNVGNTIIDADIYINSSETWTFDPQSYPKANDFVSLLAHEIGHSLGLGHPNEYVFYFDTNDDPNDRMKIDPLQPEKSKDLADKEGHPKREAFTPLPVMISPTPNPSQLANDDLSGLNYLYPECPPPTSKPSPKSQLKLQADTSSTSLGCLDYGDAPDSYKTTLAQDGPRYQEGELQLLGYLWDNEKDGQPSPGADLDDKNGGCSICFAPDDEDGVDFGDSWVDVTFNISRPDLNLYQLRAWWDTNYNGIFDHTSELYIDDLFSSEPSVFTKRYDLLGFNPKADGLYSRFRLTLDPLDLDVKPSGEYFSNLDCTLTDAAAGNCISHGEVEDYVHTPEPSSTIGILALGIIGGGATLKRKLKSANSIEK